MKSNSYSTIYSSSKEYPVNLKSIVGFPEKLYLQGSLLTRDKRAVAIVGSREMSERGRRTAEKFSKKLAKNGITIVSGLARGIDTVVHKAAIDVGGRTIAVLGSGFNNFYPKENYKLATLIKQSGAILTEFEPDTKPWGKNFLIRNRIISGLSLAVVVIEGKKRSGTLSTATHAANQGREVFAVPGTDLPDYLIENGANVADNPQVICDFINSYY